MSRASSQLVTADKAAAKAIESAMAGDPDGGDFEDAPGRVGENRNGPKLKSIREVDDAAPAGDPDDPDEIGRKGLELEDGDGQGDDPDDDLEGEEDEAAETEAEEDAPLAEEPKPKADAKPAADPIFEAGAILGYDADDVKKLVKSMGRAEVVKLLKKTRDRQLGTGGKDEPAAETPPTTPVQKQESARAQLAKLSKMADTELSAAAEAYPELKPVLDRVNTIVEYLEELSGTTTKVKTYVDRQVQQTQQAFIAQLDSAIDALATGPFEAIYGKSANIKNGSPQDAARAELLAEVGQRTRRGTPLLKAIREAHHFIHMDALLADARDGADKRLQEKVSKRSRQVDLTPTSRQATTPAPRTGKEAIRAADAAALQEIEKKFGRK